MAHGPVYMFMTSTSLRLNSKSWHSSIHTEYKDFQTKFSNKIHAKNVHQATISLVMYTNFWSQGLNHMLISMTMFVSLSVGMCVLAWLSVSVWCYVSWVCHCLRWLRRDIDCQIQRSNDSVSMGEWSLNWKFHKLNGEGVSFGGRILLSCHSSGLFQFRLRNLIRPYSNKRCVRDKPLKYNLGNFELNDLYRFLYSNKSNKPMDVKNKLTPKR